MSVFYISELINQGDIFFKSVKIRKNGNITDLKKMSP